MDPGFQQQAIWRAEKYARALERKVITLEEYAPTILTLFEVDDPFDVSIANEVCNRIPEEARSLVLKSAEEILSPDYHYILHIGGPGPSPEVREALRVKYEASIRAWAGFLVEALNRHN